MHGTTRGHCWPSLLLQRSCGLVSRDGTVSGWTRFSRWPLQRGIASSIQPPRLIQHSEISSSLRVLCLQRSSKAISPMTIHQRAPPVSSGRCCSPTPARLSITFCFTVGRSFLARAMWHCVYSRRAWSLACLPFLAGMARRTGGRGSVLPACILFALSPLAVYYSTEGRMYSLLWFCVLAVAWSSLVLRQGGGITLYLLWIAISAAGFLTHYFFVFPWMAMAAFLLIRPGNFPRKCLGDHDPYYRPGDSSLVRQPIGKPWYLAHYTRLAEMGTQRVQSLDCGARHLIAVFFGACKGALEGP